MNKDPAECGVELGEAADYHCVLSQVTFDSFISPEELESLVLKHRAEFIANPELSRLASVIHFSGHGQQVPVEPLLVVEHPGQPVAGGSRYLPQALRLLQIANLIISPKIRDEQLGDEYEWILRRHAEGMHPWLLQWMTIKAVGWALFHTLVELGKPGAIFALIYRYLAGP